MAASLLMVQLPSFAKEKDKKDSGSGKEAAFVKGSKTLGFALGLGVDYGYYTGASSLPAFGIVYDQGIINNVGPGTIGVGGILAIKTAHYKAYGYDDRWANYIIGVRGTYHLTLLKDKNNKFDPYAGVTLGVRVYHYREDDNIYSYYPDHYSGGSAYPVVGAFVGAKYNFSKHFGAFTELGYDISFFRIGINANF